jgi:hypothetical protein
LPAEDESQLLVQLREVGALRRPMKPQQGSRKDENDRRRFSSDDRASPWPFRPSCRRKPQRVVDAFERLRQRLERQLPATGKDVAEHDAERR